MTAAYNLEILGVEVLTLDEVDNAEICIDAKLSAVRYIEHRLAG